MEAREYLQMVKDKIVYDDYLSRHTRGELYKEVVKRLKDTIRRKTNHLEFLKTLKAPNPVLIRELEEERSLAQGALEIVKQMWGEERYSRLEKELEESEHITA